MLSTNPKLTKATSNSASASFHSDVSTIDYAAVVEGYTYKGEFQKDPHVVFVTKSDTIIDVYNSTFLSANEFKEKTESFFESKNIPFQKIKTIG